jgi:hypothetical protein
MSVPDSDPYVQLSSLLYIALRRRLKCTMKYYRQLANRTYRMRAAVYRDWMSRNHYVDEARVTALMTDEHSLHLAVVQSEDDQDEYMRIREGERMITKEFVERMERRVRNLESLLASVEGGMRR